MSVRTRRCDAVSGHVPPSGRLAATALLLITAFLASGCAALIVGGAGKPGSYPETSRSEAQVSADERVDSLVREAFRADRYLKSAQTSVSTYNGLVTLTGSVTSYEARSQAETLAAGVQGVRGVHNKIQVSNTY